MATQPPKNIWVRIAGDKAMIRFLTRLNVLFYKATGGKFTNTVDGCPVCLLTMIGAKSGKKRTIALMCNTLDDKVLLVASLGGAEKNPAWYHNVIANPEIEVQIGRVRRKMVAHQADSEEKKVYWPVVVDGFPAYREYQAKTERDIPLLVCSPSVM